MPQTRGRFRDFGETSADVRAGRRIGALRWRGRLAQENQCYAEQHKADQSSGDEDFMPTSICDGRAQRRCADGSAHHADGVDGAGKYGKAFRRKPVVDQPYRGNKGEGCAKSREHAALPAESRRGDERKDGDTHRATEAAKENEFLCTVSVQRKADDNLHRRINPEEQAGEGTERSVVEAVESLDLPGCEARFDTRNKLEQEEKRGNYKSGPGSTHDPSPKP